MRANKASRFLRKLTAVILSIGLIAVPCLECSSGSMVSLAASNDGLASEEGAESGTQYRTPTELGKAQGQFAKQESVPDSAGNSVNEAPELEHNTKQPATPTELEEPMLNRDNTLANSVAPDAAGNANTDSKAELKKRALIIISNEESIAASTHLDAEMLNAALKQTNEFKDCADEDITVMYFDYDIYQDASNKQKVWNWINETAQNQSDESLTVIAYAGHGDYNNDGTTYLAIGGDSSISAAELKKYTGALHGDVMLITECCFAGGMIMPIAGGDDEFVVPDAEELSRQAQSQSDKFAADFASDFKSASTAAVDDDADEDIDANAASADDDTDANAASAASINETALPEASAAGIGKAPRYFIFAASSPYEYGWGTGLSGSDMLNAIVNGLGYNYYNRYYNIFNADTNRDYKVTVAELAAYVKSALGIAEPTVAPAGSNAVLFTYDSDGYAPALFNIKAVDSDNVKVEEDKVTVKLDIRSYAEADIKLAFAAYKPSINTGLNLSDTMLDFDTMKFLDSKYIMLAENNCTIDAGSTKQITLEFDGSRLSDKLANGGRYVIKACGYDVSSSGYFAYTTFTVANGGKEEAEIPDKDAFAVKSPAVVSKVLDAVKASQLVPVRVTFDTEPTERKGSAACVLSAVACRLGDEEEVTRAGYYVGSDGLPIDGNGSEVEFTTANSAAVFEDVRPFYGSYARDMFTYGNTVMGSSYTDSWDVSELEPGYYALKVSCRYDDGAVAYRTTFVKVTDRAEADADDYKIGELFVGMTGLGISFYADGNEIGRSVKEISEFFEWNLNNRAISGYEGLEQDNTGSAAAGDAKKNVSYTVGGWELYDSDKDEWVKLKAADILSFGNLYSSEITIKLADNYKARFTDGTVFTFSHHDLYEGRNEISADGRQAKVTVLHYLTDIGSDDISVTDDSTGAQLENGDRLYIGQLINVAYDRNRYSLWATGALNMKKEYADCTQYEVVEPADNSNSVYFFVYDISSDTEITGGCGCSVLALFYEVDTSSQGDGDEGDDESGSGDDSGGSQEQTNPDGSGDQANPDSGSGDKVTPDGGTGGNQGGSSSSGNETASGVNKSGRNSSGRAVSNKTLASGQSAGTGQDGVIIGSWQRESDGTWHYALSGGGYAKGWSRISYNDTARWFYFDDDKDMHTGWLQDNGRWYYLDSDGAMLTGWVKDKDAWYFLDADGSMHTGWLKDKDKWYYLGSDGAMLTGRIEDNGKRYYIGADGTLRP